MPLRFFKRMLLVLVIVAFAAVLVSTAQAKSLQIGVCSAAPLVASSAAGVGPDVLGLCCTRILGICWCWICQYPGWNNC